VYGIASDVVENARVELTGFPSESPKLTAEAIPSSRGIDDAPPVLDDAGLAADRMRAMLDKGADHAAVLSRLLRVLSPEDEATPHRPAGPRAPGR
jgi:hypothetical protein